MRIRPRLFEQTVFVLMGLDPRPVEAGYTKHSLRLAKADPDAKIPVGRVQDLPNLL
jgi:hypothetical protein